MVVLVGGQITRVGNEKFTKDDCKITLNKATTESLINTAVVEYVQTSEAETMMLAKYR